MSTKASSEDDVYAKVKSAVNFLFPIFCLLLVWEILARLHLVVPYLFPPPSQVFQKWISLFSPPLYIMRQDILYSLYRLMYGFLLSAGIGIALGITMGLSNKVYKFFTPLLSLLLPIPSIAWIPIVILWLGLGDLTCVVIVFLAGIFSVVYNVSSGVRSVSKYHIWAAQSMGATKLQIFYKVMLPGALPYIITGLRLAMGGGWRALIAAEMLSATMWGLGYRIYQAKQFLAVDVMYAGIISLALLGFTLERIIFTYIERRTVTRWGMIREM